MALFRIAGAMSVWSYLELQITWETFWKSLWSNGSYHWRLMEKIQVRLMWGYFREAAFCHYCLFWLWYLCYWYVNAGYEWRKKEYKLNHLLFMDDLKLFFKSEEQIDTLVRTDHVFSTDIGIEFVLKKYGILTMKRRKVVRCEGSPK